MKDSVLDQKVYFVIQILIYTDAEIDLVYLFIKLKLLQWLCLSGF